jgi:tetratricopeptide (TPR) repeat protein
LFVNDQRIRFANPVHELVEPSLKDIGIQIKNCAIPVHHYGRLDQDRVIAKGKEYYRLGKNKVLESNGDYQALKQLAIQASEIGEYAEALTIWEELLKRNPNDPAVHLNLGFAHIRLSQYDQGLICSRNAYDMNPNSKEAGLNYAGCELVAGDVTKAISVLEQLLNKNTVYPPALARLSAAYLLAGQRQKGLKCLERLRSDRFDCAEILSEQARLFLSQGRVENAILLLEAAIETNNVNADTHLLLGECRRNQKPSIPLEVAEWSELPVGAPAPERHA